MLKISSKGPIFFTLVFYLACLFIALRVHVDERVTALLPDSDPEVVDFKNFITMVPAAQALYIQIDTKDTNPDLLAQAGDAFFNAIKDAPFFDDILYQFDRQSLFALMDLVNKKKYMLMDAVDLQQVQQLTATDHIGPQIVDIKKELLSPAGALSARNKPRDPFGLDYIILKKLSAFQSEMPGAQAGQSRIINKEGTSLLMVATPVAPAVDTSASQKMFAFLYQERQRITRDLGNTIHIGFSGVHRATLDNASTIQSDIKRTIMVLSIGILVVGILFFSRIYHVLLIFVPTLVSLGLAGAVAALSTHTISAIALGCGALLVGITVDFGIHILFHADTLGTAHVKEIIKKLKAPIITGAATTMAAFGCLGFSSLPGQRQMGWLSIIGIAGAATFALTLLPAFICVKPWTPSKPVISLLNVSRTVMNFRKKHKKFLIFTCLSLVVAGITGLGNFSFNGDVNALNHLTPEAQQEMDHFLATWGQTPSTIFMVQARDTQTALQKNDQLFELLKTMEKQGQITDIASLSAILPSKAQQEKRLEGLQALFSAQRVNALKTDLEQACLANGFTPNAFSPFTDELENITRGTGPAPVASDDFKQTVIYPLIKSKLITTSRGTLVLTNAMIPDKTLIPSVTRTIKDQLPGTLVINKPYVIEKISGRVADEFKNFLIWAALSIFVVLCVCQHNIKMVITTLTPVLLSAVVTAGLLGIFGISVNLISIVFIIFVFGVGVDFSIFMVHNGLSHSEESRHITPGAVLICAMTTIGGFASLSVARHKALFSIGVAGLTGMTVSLFMALAIIPFLTEHWILKNSKDVNRKN
ncbi:MMPL family transporter [uncultured Desulfobacter sp.]|uniref:MMPL family transporter n=1 Tax=uncultured Desulfobacter sp. TaxID=240139 RepID=UPI002AABB552|nr:MMPL family transporter [uncultured Desulfobacter sp.]